MRDKKFLIVGLGLLGGSYARALKKLGFYVSAVDINSNSINYALSEKIIDDGASFADERLIGEADIVIFGLYPAASVDWIRNNQKFFKPGVVLLDTAGVKRGVVDVIQKFLRKDIEFLGCHPMAGREASGVINSSEAIFYGANFIITPTNLNTDIAVNTACELAKLLGFGKISVLSIDEHDKMIGFLSQLTHVIAVSLMNCSDNTHLADYTGDSFRDLTRIAKINENLWGELFILNKSILVDEINGFIEELNNFKDRLINEDIDAMKKLFIQSTKRRTLFDKK